MYNLYELILSLCTQVGIRPGKMCNDLGLSRGMMTDLKMGRKQTLSADTLSKIAAYFNVSVDYLLGNEEKEQPALSKEDELQDEFFAFYGEVKPYLDERDIDD